MASEVQPMIAELGHYALMLALGLALIQGTMPIVGTRTNDPVLMSIAAPTALAQFAFVAMAFTALAICYVISDFSVENVYQNSNSQMPLIYRLTSIWGNHEGSMMLWVSILTFFGALVAVFGNNLPVVLKAHALAFRKRHLKVRILIRFCRTLASRFIRRSCTSAMLDSRSHSLLRLPRCWRGASTRLGRAGFVRGCSAPGCV
jgi:hypothetical protein